MDNSISLNHSHKFTPCQKAVLALVSLAAITAVALGVLNLTGQLSWALTKPACYAILGSSAALLAISGILTLIFSLRHRAFLEQLRKENTQEKYDPAEVPLEEKNKKSTADGDHLKYMGVSTARMSQERNELTLDDLKRLMADNISKGRRVYFGVTDGDIIYTSIPLSNCKLHKIPASLAELASPPRDLNLSNNHILQLPGENEGNLCEKLREVVELNLNHNNPLNLNNISEVFPNVKRLYLVSCGLSVLPDGFVDLTQLEQLNLSGNLLDVVSDALAPLRLRFLNLSSNKLKELPAFMEGGGYVARDKLEILDLSGNRELELSETMIAALKQFRNLRDIRIDGTRIEQDVCNEILDATATLRRRISSMRRLERVRIDASSPLMAEIYAWKQSANRSHESWDGELLLDREQVEALCAWLPRLRNTRQYQLFPMEFSSTVCDVLKKAFEKKELLEFMAGIAVGDLTGCGDRAAGSFTDVYTQYLIHSLDETATLAEVIAILVSHRRAQLVRYYVSNEAEFVRSVSGLFPTQEMVEVYLWADLKLREVLGLKLPIANMLFGFIGQQPWLLRKTTIADHERKHPLSGRPMWTQPFVEARRVIDQIGEEIRLRHPVTQILCESDTPEKESMWSAHLERDPIWGPARRVILDFVTAVADDFVFGDEEDPNPDSPGICHIYVGLSDEEKVDPKSLHANMLLRMERLYFEWTKESEEQAERVGRLIPAFKEALEAWKAGQPGSDFDQDFQAWRLEAPAGPLRAALDYALQLKAEGRWSGKLFDLEQKLKNGFENAFRAWLGPKSESPDEDELQKNLNEWIATFFFEPQFLSCCKNLLEEQEAEIQKEKAAIVHFEEALNKGDSASLTLLRTSLEDCKAHEAERLIAAVDFWQNSKGEADRVGWQRTLNQWIENHKTRMRIRETLDKQLFATTTDNRFHCVVGRRVAAIQAAYQEAFGDGAVWLQTASVQLFQKQYALWKKGWDARKEAVAKLSDALTVKWKGKEAANEENLIRQFDAFFTGKRVLTHRSFKRLNTQYFAWSERRERLPQGVDSELTDVLFYWQQKLDAPESCKPMEAKWQVAFNKWRDQKQELYKGFRFWFEERERIEEQIESWEQLHQMRSSADFRSAVKEVFESWITHPAPDVNLDGDRTKFFTVQLPYYRQAVSEVITKRILEYPEIREKLRTLHNLTL